MKKNILLVQFRIKKPTIHYEKVCIRRCFKTKGLNLKIESVFDIQNKFFHPFKILKGMNEVILGGSAEFDFSGNNPKQEKIFQDMIKRIKPFIRYLINKDIPTLGICFGHQLLGHVLGTKVIKDKFQQETGSFLVSLTQKGKSDFLFNGVPLKFIAQFGHKDSLEKLPTGAILLAKSKKCKVVAFRYKKNIYGVQFHPELTVKDVILRLKYNPDYAGGKKIAEIKKNLKPSPFSLKILRNFSKLV